MRKSTTIILIILLSFPLVSLAASVKNGVLQAYWLPIWKDSVNSPELQLRFFVLSNEGKQQKIINIDSGPVNKAFIKENFRKSTDDFLNFKEGHIEQAGRVSLVDITSTNECDSRIWHAKIIEFEAMKANLKLDEGIVDCNRFPYLITYQLKEGIDTIDLLDQPNVSAKQVGAVNNQHTFVKIKTINPEWLYVAVYDASKKDLVGWPRGYVKQEDLTPVN